MGFPDDAGLGIECESSKPDKKRKWIFTVEDFEGTEEYVDAEGNQIDEVSAKENVFIGLLSEANTEGERRADLWEEKNDAFVAKVTYHSQGVVQ